MAVGPTKMYKGVVLVCDVDQAGVDIGNLIDKAGPGGPPHLPRVKGRLMSRRVALAAFAGFSAAVLMLTARQAEPPAAPGARPAALRRRFHTLAAGGAAHAGRMRRLEDLTENPATVCVHGSVGVVDDSDVTVTGAATIRSRGECHPACWSACFACVPCFGGLCAKGTGE